MAWLLGQMMAVKFLRLEDIPGQPETWYCYTPWTTGHIVCWGKYYMYFILSVVINDGRLLVSTSRRFPGQPGIMVLLYTLNHRGILFAEVNIKRLRCRNILGRYIVFVKVIYLSSPQSLVVSFKYVVNFDGKVRRNESMISTMLYSKFNTTIDIVSEGKLTIQFQVVCKLIQQTLTIGLTKPNQIKVYYPRTPILSSWYIMRPWNYF